MAKTRGRAGFTLIELLIVVAIIAILAAVAVPNFLEAQVRAKVTRTKADIRSIAVALEAYGVDNNAYPIVRAFLIQNPTSVDRGGIGGVTDLTTPIAYLTSVVIKDPFLPEVGYDAFGTTYTFRDPLGTLSRTMSYMNITENRKARGLGPCEVAWFQMSLGPDMRRGPIPGVANPWGATYAGIGTNTPAQHQYFVYALYDPTNGTVSGGDILAYQGRSF